MALQAAIRFVMQGNPITKGWQHGWDDHTKGDADRAIVHALMDLTDSSNGNVVFTTQRDGAMHGGEAFVEVQINEAELNQWRDKIRERYPTLVGQREIAA